MIQYFTIYCQTTYSFYICNWAVLHENKEIYET